MLTVRALISLGNIVLLGSIKAVPGVTTPDEVIDGFPEFAFTVDAIKDPVVKDKLRKIAKKIVASHASGPNRIIGFEVHGHADQTVRIAAGAERDQAEFEVSRDRAENARDLLFQLIEEEGGKPIITGIKANSDAQGFGSKHRIFKPATTEPQMRTNRRVEIFLRQFVQPPPQPSPPDPPPKPEVRSRWQIKIKSGLMVFVSTPVPGTALTVNVRLETIIFDLDRKEQAKFKVRAIGKAVPPLGVGGFQPLISVNIGEGPPSNFNALEGTRLGNFDGSLVIAMNPGVTGIGLGGAFVMFFEALAGPTRPTPVEVTGGNVIGLPQLLVPMIPTNGSLKMDGQPTKTP